VDVDTVDNFLDVRLEDMVFLGPCCFFDMKDTNALALFVDLAASLE